MDSTLSTPPSAKRVRWDESVPPDPPQAAPSCNANDAIKLSSAVVSCDAAPASEAKDSGSGKEEEEVCDRNRGGFRPDFTHQLFDEERIQGFKDGALTIQVLYTPTSLDFLVKIQTSEEEEGSTSRTADVLSRLSKALPAENYTTDERSFYQQLEGRRRDFKPPGARVHEYRRGEKVFSVYRATGEEPGTCEYHGRAQCLAPWFIEAADDIDLSDDRWEVFYLFEEETPREVLGEKWRPAALAGYFTVFGFRNPVKGVSLRICQALVLPQFQRQGHGQALLTFLYGLARSRESVFEITVEDPAPGFEKVRNLVDARTLRDLDAFPADALSSDAFKRPSKDVVQAAHKASKLTVSQVEIGFDILKACDVPEASRPSGDAAAAVTTAASSAGAKTDSSRSVSTSSSPGVPEDAKEEALVVDDKGKRYRLMVKRRLLKRHGEELSTDATTRKRQLEELYRDVEAGLLSLGAKLRAEEQGKK